MYKTASDAKHAVGRTINALITELNEKNQTLPKYLVVVMDKDILEDFDKICENSINNDIAEIVNWFVHQIQMVIRRKRIDLLEKKPGSLTNLSTSIIFVRMIRHIGSFQPNSRMQKICDLRLRFNDSLNDATAKIQQHILTINSCSSYDHFDKRGMLSLFGKTNFWNEVDSLLQRFDMHKIKLLPNPKNPPRRVNNHHQHRRMGKHQHRKINHPEGYHSQRDFSGYYHHY